MISLSVLKKTLDLLISNEEFKKRKSKLITKNPIFKRNYQKLYNENVLPATEGCDFYFLTGFEK